MDRAVVHGERGPVGEGRAADRALKGAQVRAAPRAPFRPAIARRARLALSERLGALGEDPRSARDVVGVLVGNLPPGARSGGGREKGFKSCTAAARWTRASFPRRGPRARLQVWAGTRAGAHKDQFQTSEEAECLRLAKLADQGAVGAVARIEEHPPPVLEGNVDSRDRAVLEGRRCAGPQQHNSLHAQPALVALRLPILQLHARVLPRTLPLPRPPPSANAVPPP